MALEVIQLENQLMKSNCFIIVDWDSNSCVIIDPASEKSEREIAYIEEHNLRLDYILLTHEHADHTWGVNALKEKYNDAKLVCSELCEKNAKKTSKAYFLLYYDKKGYRYELLPADVIIHTDEDTIKWNNFDIHFVMTPGHSFGSMCIDVGGMLFTGDTIMPFEPYFNGRDSNEKEWKSSIVRILNTYDMSAMFYPGHGEPITLNEWNKQNYINIAKNESNTSCR